MVLQTNDNNENLWFEAKYNGGMLLQQSIDICSLRASEDKIQPNFLDGDGSTLDPLSVDQALKQMEVMGWRTKKHANNGHAPVYVACVISKTSFMTTIVIESYITSRCLIAICN